MRKVVDVVATADPRVIACWAVQGGSGTSVVAAGLACALARRSSPVLGTLLVDGVGDQAALFGVDADGPGLADWLRAGDAVPPDGLARIEVPAAAGVSLIPCGPGELPTDRVDVLVALLRADPRPVVVDAGLGPLGTAVLAEADASILVARACPVALARLRQRPAAPTAVVVVRGHRRSTSRHDIARAAGAPVRAELDLDPAVGAAVDAGLAHRQLPRRVLRVLEQVV